MDTKCPKCQTSNPSDSKYCKECATPLPSHQDIEVTETMETPKEELSTGSIFAARYQIIEELGKGGMGRVYRALDKELNEEVAIKLIKPEIAKDKKTIERFKNELRFARKISHRNVGRMYELMEDRGSHFITMEYVPGQDLRGLIRQTGQLTTGKAIAIAKEICAGLGEAHHHGVIHRDLKPSNIIIDKNGNARILDFGIARSIEGKAITGAGVMIGTPEYMSPEQVEGKEVDQRSDIYSLGVILYEMVTGKVPFEGDTPFTVGVKHKSEIPQNPKEINSQIPDELNMLILKCLEKDKEKRYQNAGKVRSEMDRLEQGLPASEKAIPKTRPLTSREITVQFNLKKIFIPALVIIVLIAAALFFVLRTGPKNYSYHVVVAEFINRTGDPNIDSIGRQAAESVSQGLENLGLFGVAPLTRFDLGSNTNLEEKDYRQIAENSDAAIVVTGELYLQGTDLEIRSKLYDALKQRPLPSPNAVSGKVNDYSEFFEKLTDRLKSAVMGTYDPKVEMWQKISPYVPPYDALLEFISGMGLFMQLQNPQYSLAAEYLERAVGIDPNYFLAHAFALLAHISSGHISKVEQYLEKIHQFAKMSPGERYLVDMIEAFIEGDNESGYLFSKQLEELSPGKTLSYYLAYFAIATNRPHAAIASMERLYQNRIFVDCSYCYSYFLTFAYHMIGNHKQELKEALRAQKQLPQNWEPLWFKIYALSALGELDEVNKVLEESHAKPITSDQYPGALIVDAGKEFLIHGHNEEAAEMFEQALNWFQQRSLREELSVNMESKLAWTQFYNQNWEEAEAAFGKLLESSPESLGYLGALGVVAAKRGDRQKALQISERLKNWDKPYSRGQHTFLQACILANLGEKEQAVSLLQTALQQGYSYGDLYFSVTLEPLWDYPAFIEMLKPLD